MGKALRVGEFELHWLPGGTFELDGGTMFGAVPRALWSRRYPHGRDNRITLLNSPLLVRTPRALAIIDTGLGNKLTAKQKKTFRVRREWDLPRELEAMGIGLEEIDCVVLTHLDFDHSGGVVMDDGRGGLRLTFSRARHIVQEAEWADAMNPGPREAEAYWPVNFGLLKERPDLLEIINGDCEPTPGLRVVHTGGHTRGHQVVKLSSGGREAIHMADLLPTHVHFNPLWVMAYDNFPLEAIEQKKRLEAEATAAGAWFTFYHDPFMAACRFDAGGNVMEKWEHQEGP
jgi:glyoxylase-like metal-dependent hydrolase (beta-lactamase superfamily II)